MPRNRDTLNIGQLPFVWQRTWWCGITQIFGRVVLRSAVRHLTRTVFDLMTTGRPKVKPFLASGGRRRHCVERFGFMLSDMSFSRSPEALDQLTNPPKAEVDGSIEKYCARLGQQRARTLDLHLPRKPSTTSNLAIGSAAENSEAPPLIVWGRMNVYFDVKLSHWLAETHSGTRRALSSRPRLFCPENAGIVQQRHTRHCRWRDRRRNELTDQTRKADNFALRHISPKAPRSSEHLRCWRRQASSARGPKPSRRSVSRGLANANVPFSVRTHPLTLSIENPAPDRPERRDLPVTI